MKTINYEQLQNALKTKRICRFCLCQNAAKLSSIYMRDTRIKTSAPLPMQIMAIASIEVYTNDGMPCYICTDCTKYFEYSYQFKQMCKKADNLLRQFPLTGKWPSELEKPLFPQVDERTIIASTPNRKTHASHGRNNQKPQIQTPCQRQSIPLKSAATGNVPGSASPMKILNVDPSVKPEPPVPIRPKMENLDEEAATIFLNKIENDDELLIDDVQRLVASVNGEEEKEELMEEMEFVNMNSLPVVVLDPTNVNVKPSITMVSSNTKPKLLNKSSVRILNKEADKNIEPRLSLPKVKHDEEGNVEIVAEILEFDEPYEDEADPRDAAPVEIHVFPCPHCERSFPLRQLRDIHVKNHKRERNFVCEECNKSFFSKYDLQKHCLTHSDDKPFKCSACGKSFTRGTLLYRHERTHTDLPKYICVHCERPFLSSEDLNKHIKRHTKHRPFQCKLCHKAFAFKQGLERHEVVHSRQQPYPCQYCDQSFSTTSKLARHLTAHAGDRPYPCKFCAKSYLLSHHLTRHMRSHKNANIHSAIAFNCNICNETFGSRESLITHSAKHATDDSLVCPLCKECFDNLENVTNHIRHHSDGEAYACEFCDLIFLSSGKLHAHTEVDHADDMIAYRENDKVQADKRKVRQKANVKSQQQGQEKNRNEIGNDNDDLQNTVNSILTDDLNDSTLFQRKIKNEPQEHTTGKSSKTFKQLSSPNERNERTVGGINDHENKDNDREYNNEELPSKLRKLEKSRSRTTTKLTRSTKLRIDQHKLSDRAATITNSSHKALSNKKENNKDKNITVEVLARKILAIDMNRKLSPPPNAIIEHQNQLSLWQKNKVNATSLKSASTITMGENKVKLQMISVSKSEAIGLERADRLYLDDGNVMLKKRVVKKKKIK